MTDYEQDQQPEEHPESQPKLEPPPDQPKLPGADEPEKLQQPAEPLLPEMSEDARDNRAMAAICYLGVLFVVPLLAKERSQFALFHCRQGIMLFAFQSLLSFVVWIPYIGPLLLVLLMAVSLIGVVMAWKGREWKLPVLHKYAEMLKL